MSKLHFYLILLYAVAALAADVDLRCTEAYCTTYIEETGCPTLPNHCIEGTLDPTKGTVFPSPSICNCCQFCITYLSAGAACVIGGSGQPVPAKVCGPGLTCELAQPTDQSSTCVDLSTPCALAQEEWDVMRHNGTLGFRIPRPDCDDEGDFIPAHCIPGSTCYCVSPTGERIFGEAPYTSTSTPQRMDCPCSVQGWQARVGFHGSAELLVSRCSAEGKYDALQCVDNKCFCVDTEDGLVQGTEYRHIVDLEELKCFDPLVHTAGRYMTECEQARYDVEQTLALLALDEILGLGLKTPSCDADGRYSKLQQLATTKVCVDSNNQKIEDFEVLKISPAAKEMDCNCARTRWVLSTQLATGNLLELPSCCTNGNYARWQCRRGFCYCVDNNGNQEGLENPDERLLECYDSKGPCTIYS